MFCCRNNNVLIQAAAADLAGGIVHLMIYALYLSPFSNSPDTDIGTISGP